MNTEAPQPTAADDFVSYAGRNNFYQTCAFIPMSFALVTTVHENGETGIGPHALVMPFGISPPYSMLLISRGNSATASNIRRTGKCALNYIEFDRDRLTAVSRLGYPGQSLEEKQKAMPFTLLPSPSADRQNDPEAPRILGDAFQIIECSWDRSFDLDAPRTDAGGAERAPLCPADRPSADAPEFSRCTGKRRHLPDHADFLRISQQWWLLVCRARRAFQHFAASG